MNKLGITFASFVSLGLITGIASADDSLLCGGPIPNEGYLKSFQGLQPGRDDWLFRNHDLIEDFGPSRNGYNGLRAIQQKLADRGTTLMIVPLPTRGIVHPEYVLDPEFNHKQSAKNYYLYLNRLRRVGLVVPPLDKLTAGDQEIPLFFARDHHWTPDGAAATARLVSEELSSTGLLDESPALKFSTSTVEVQNNSGSYSRAAAELCNSQYEPESFNVYYTEAELDLFAEVSEPDVVLVGTSNSNGTMSFNFDGFLRRELGVDVLNVATSGGGFDSSLVNYLGSDKFKQNPPVLIIWEVPGYYSLSQAEFYDTVLDVLEGES